MKKKPIRILHVVQRMEAAGLQSFIMNIYRTIDRSQMQFDFLTHYKERQFYDDEIERLGGRIYRLSVREDKNPVKYLKELKKFFREHQEYEIVHGHMDSLGLFYLEAAKLSGIDNRIAHAHTVIIGGDLKKRLRNLLNKGYKVNATCLLACSEDAGRYMFGDSDFKVIHNPIDVQRFAYNETVRNIVRAELGVQDKIVIGHVGRFSYSKNHEFLLQIFQQITKIEDRAVLVLVGQGELETEIHHQAKELGIEDRFFYLGVRADVERLYQAFDSFVFPSRFEGLGIVAIEAQAAGLPTVCSDSVPQFANATDLFTTMPLSASSKEWAETVMDRINIGSRKGRSQELMDAGYDVNKVSVELIELYGNMIGWGGGVNVFLLLIPFIGSPASGCLSTEQNSLSDRAAA